MNWWQSLRNNYEDWLWKNSTERLQLARNRLALHQRAIDEGQPGPYLEPEKYNLY
tara:strand:- start:313 stop:477 length:165 start_codon:yes stop_codon:yes gene_type:complete